jgi:hypothetical protein
MSSVYQDYKLSTSRFQKWILKTSARKGLPNTLNFLRIHVENIVQNVVALTKQKNFLQDLKAALTNGKAAIKARKAVHLTKVNEIPKTVSPEEYQKYLEDNGKHAHCIQLLQECWDNLSSLAPDTSNSGTDKKIASEKEPNLSSESLAKKFSSLEVQDLPDENTAALNLQVDEEIDLDTLDLQYGDIRLRLICFFIEMTQLDEYLVQTWKRVQILEVSLPSATVVTLAAIQKIKIIESELSVIYPSFSNAVAFFAAFKQFLSPMEMANIAEHPTYQLLSIIMHFYTSYGGQLKTSNCPFSHRNNMLAQRGGSEQKVYTECTMPRLGNDRTTILWFLDTEVTAFYNALIFMRDFKDDYDEFLEHFHTRPEHLTMAGFVKEFIDFFDSFNQSTTLLFMSLCWIRSVQCMVDSDKMTLSKNVYLYRSFVRQRSTNCLIHTEKLEKIMKYLEAHSADPFVFEGITALRSTYNHEVIGLSSLGSWMVHHNNPLLVGGYFLDTVFADQTMCGGLMKRFSHFHKFIPWFYFALKETGFFVDGEIPFIEDYAKLVERVYSLKNASNDPPASQYVNFLSKSFKDKGYYPAMNNGLISKAMEKMPLDPFDASSLYSIVTMDDHSSLNAESIHSYEAFDELISITEKELLESNYLSVDLLKYFVSFNHFVLYLHEERNVPGFTPNPVKEWSEIDFLNANWTFYEWTQNILFPLLAKYLKTPAAKRTTADSILANYFIQSMKSYFNGQTKDSEECGERTFIIDPQFTNNWGDIYLSRFRESYSLGMTKILQSIPALSNSTLEKYSEFIRDLGNKQSSSSGLEDLSKLKLVTLIKKFAADHMKSIIAKERSHRFSFCLLTTLANPKIFDPELAEFVFVTFGCFLYLSLFEGGRVFSPVLFAVCSQGNVWSLDLLMSVTNLENMFSKEENTGDTVFHISAKRSQLGVLEYLLMYGYLPVLIDITGKRSPHTFNNEGKQFPFYVQDPAMRRRYESQLIDRFDTKMKHMAAKCRAKGEVRVSPFTEFLDRFQSQEGALSTSLKRDAREETVKDVKKEVKKGKGGVKSQEIVQEVTKADEEKAKQAELELLAMLEGEEKQSAKGKQKPKKKPSK